MNKERKDLYTIYEFMENNRNEKQFKEKKKTLNNKCIYNIIFFIKIYFIL